LYPQTLHNFEDESNFTLLIIIIIYQN